MADAVAPSVAIQQSSAVDTGNVSTNLAKKAQQLELLLQQYASKGLQNTEQFNKIKKALVETYDKLRIKRQQPLFQTQHNQNPTNHQSAIPPQLNVVSNSSLGTTTQREQTGIPQGMMSMSDVAMMRTTASLSAAMSSVAKRKNEVLQCKLNVQRAQSLYEQQCKKLSLVSDESDKMRLFVPSSSTEIIPGKMPVTPETLGPWFKCDAVKQNGNHNDAGSTTSESNGHLMHHPVVMDIAKIKAKNIARIENLLKSEIEALQNKVNTESNNFTKSNDLTYSNPDDKSQLNEEIKLKALRLLTIQRNARTAVVEEYEKEMVRMPLERPWFVPHSGFRQRLRVPRREFKMHAREREVKRMSDEESFASKHREFLRTVIFHSKDFKEWHRKRVKITRRIARNLKDELEKRARGKDREVDRLKRQRLRALRENDMEAYKKLIDKTKNERITYLLNQTETFLNNLGSLVLKSKEISKQAKKSTKSSRRISHVGENTKKSDSSLHQSDDDLMAQSSSSDDETIETSETSENSDGNNGNTNYLYDLAHNKSSKIIKQPSILVGGTLKEYQLSGLQWLASLYENNLNGILADEMGLGKTIQTIALLTYLMEVKRNGGPYLIVVPLSTMSNWANELEKWAPSCVFVAYKGNPTRRKALYREEMQGGQFNVLLTTYDYVMKDKSLLRKTLWQYIIVDEGHRMKNANCKFSQILGNAYRANHRLLLTGTPLQNSLQELWALLNFLLPHIFHSVDSFEQWFNKPFSKFRSAGKAPTNALTTEESELEEEEKLLVIHRLHQVLRPFLLRRMKSDVLGQLPEKVERVIKCDLSAWQQLSYSQIQKHGNTVLQSGKSGGLTNIIMQLRKICNHPYLFMQNNWKNDFDIVRSSGKVELLDRILPKLQASGHRVLIFSQMTQLMNILEDYFALRSYRYLRLDGSTKTEIREQAMHRFNAPDSPYFIFLLSTRAGGLGVNLQTADTVVIFDSDWNPQMDLQAQDRAHRIGQKREVRVFRLITNTPIEERILSRAHDKLSMESLVIKAGSFNTKAKGVNRKEMIREFLSKMNVEEEAKEEVPDDEVLNEMLARDEEERVLFNQIDAQRIKKSKIEWEKSKMKDPSLKGECPPRLMQHEDIPLWVRNGHKRLEDERNSAAANLIAQEALLGTGKRQKKTISYTDGLTERQFLRQVEKGEGAEGLEKAAATKRRRLQARNNTPKDVPLSPDSLKVLQKTLLKVIDSVVDTFDSQGYSVSDLFLEKPDKDLYKDYYRVIKRPIGIYDIRRKLESGIRKKFDDAWKLLFRNAHRYNQPGTLVVQYADILQKKLEQNMKNVERKI